MPRRNKTAPPVALDRLVRRVATHLPGAGCLCAAYGESECGCPNVDWRSKREIALQTALEHCLSTLKSYHTTKPGITETIRQTEMIRDAGNYRTNATAQTPPDSGTKDHG
jgi:hypothetical protein